MVRAGAGGRPGDRRHVVGLLQQILAEMVGVRQRNRVDPVETGAAQPLCRLAGRRDQAVK